MPLSDSTLKPDARQVPKRLNKECFCITLERDELCAALNHEAADSEFFSRFIKARPHLFSNAPVFIAQSDILAMLGIVRAIEAASRLPGYREAALAWLDHSGYLLAIVRNVEWSKALTADRMPKLIISTGVMAAS
jgi:hypothetical protein